MNNLCTIIFTLLYQSALLCLMLIQVWIGISLIHIHLIQVCNFLVGLFFLDLVENFGVAPVYATFGGVSLLAAIFASYFIVETKGRSLEEIEMSLNPNFSASDPNFKGGGAEEK